jgi:hypothetical protein
MGAGTGLYQAHTAAEERAQEQIQSLSLKPTRGAVAGGVFKLLVLAVNAFAVWLLPV